MFVKLKLCFHPEFFITVVWKIAFTPKCSESLIPVHQNYGKNLMILWTLESGPRLIIEVTGRKDSNGLLLPIHLTVSEFFQKETWFNSPLLKIFKPDFLTFQNNIPSLSFISNFVRQKTKFDVCRGRDGVKLKKIYFCKLVPNAENS